MMDKNSCRKLINDRLSLLNKEYRLKTAKRICKRVMKMDCVINSKVIMCYRNSENEVDVDLLAYQLQKQNKLVCFPKMVEKQIIALYPKDNQFIRGPYNILEPISSSSIQIEKEAIDVIVVPLVAFDKRCHRLGHGKGYYDRFLQDYQGVTIGVGFKQQFIKEIPVDENDQILDYVITDTYKYKNKRR